MSIIPLSAIIDSHSIMHFSFPYDLQIQISNTSDEISVLLHPMQSSISDVKAWATANMLRRNYKKKIHMLVTTNSIKHLHTLPTSITISNAEIPFEQSVKNKGLN